MSGGRFSQVTHELKQVAYELRQLIDNNDDEGAWEHGTGGYKFEPETLQAFLTALRILREAAVYIHRIDWLLANDDSEPAFHRRLKENLTELHCDNPYPDIPWIRVIDEALVNNSVDIASAEDTYEVAKKKLEQLIQCEIDIAKYFQDNPE